MRIISVMLALAFVASGCGGNDNPLGRVKIAGKVSLGGQPLKQGSISFEPQGTGKTSSGGMIEGGAYSLPVAQGLVPGDYVVRISATEGGPALEAAPGESSEVAKEVIPPEFNSSSTQRVTVKPVGDNTFNFEIPTASK